MANLQLSTLLVSGNWGSWSEYGQCSTSCGGGIKNKTRSCDNPRPIHGGQNCPGEDTETQPCNTHACPGIIIFKLPFCFIYSYMLCLVR